MEHHTLEFEQYNPETRSWSPATDVTPNNRHSILAECGISEYKSQDASTLIIARKDTHIYTVNPDTQEILSSVISYSDSWFHLDANAAAIIIPMRFNRHRAIIKPVPTVTT